MNVTSTVVATALAAGLATTACSASGRPRTTVITATPAPAPTPSSSPIDNQPPLSLVDPLEADAASSDDPVGTPVQFAIRYLNDLRIGDWNAALNEMAYVERATVDLNDAAEAVGRDVLRNARGGSGHLALCTSARQFASDAVIVGCGDTNVVVHVETRAGFRGVKVSEVFVAGDHPGIPHTHAYTRLL